MKITADKEDGPYRDLAGERHVAPIRRNEDGEYFLLSECGGNLEVAQWLVERSNREAAGWAQANPVVRYQPVKIMAVAVK